MPVPGGAHWGDLALVWLTGAFFDRNAARLEAAASSGSFFGQAQRPRRRLLSSETRSAAARTSRTSVTSQWAAGLKNSARETMPPIIEPPMPQVTVHQKPIGLGPGTTRRPREPTKRPPTSTDSTRKSTNPSCQTWGASGQRPGSVLRRWRHLDQAPVLAGKVPEVDPGWLGTRQGEGGADLAAVVRAVVECLSEPDTNGGLGP